MNPEKDQDAIAVDDLDPIDQAMYYLNLAIKAMRKAKPAEPSELARYCQIVITDTEKVRALWDSWVCRYTPEDEAASVADFAVVRETKHKEWALEALRFAYGFPPVEAMPPKPSASAAFAELRKLVAETPGMEQGLTEVLAEHQGDWEPDWSIVPDKFRWVAVDRSGAVWAYIGEPMLLDEVWDVGRESCIVGFEQSRRVGATVDMTGKPSDWWRIAKWRRPEPDWTPDWSRIDSPQSEWLAVQQSGQVCTYWTEPILDEQAEKWLSQPNTP